jgi:IclR family acetate operon transcriptional repressor
MSGVQSVERAFKILEALAIAPSGVSDMARRVDLPKSTVARLLATLESTSAVERSPDGLAYRVGPALRGIAASIDGSMGLVEMARPTLVRLASLTDEAAGISVAEGYQVHYLAQADSDRTVQVRDWSGELIPMHLVPSGLAMLAHWPDEAIDGYVSRSLEGRTERSITDPDQLLVRLAEVREAGFAWGREEFAEGINSVGAAIVDGAGKVLGAIHIHGPSYRFPVAGEDERVSGLVVDAASRLAAATARLSR